jgi:hypothetical protein
MTGGRGRYPIHQGRLGDQRDTLEANDIKVLIHAVFSACIGIGMVLLLLG